MANPAIDPNPPQWEILTVQNMQAQADNQFAQQKLAYMAACQGWITSNTNARNIGAPLTPPPVMPLHKVWHCGEAGQPFVTLEQDPTLTVPVLPPQVPQLPSTPLSSGASANTDSENAMLQTILNLLIAIKEKLEA